MTQKYTKHVLPCSPHTWQWTIPPFTNVFSIQTSTVCNEYLQGHGKSSHIGYGITMDNLTHQGLAITGDTMQQKPLINRGFMVLQSKKPTSKNHGTDWTRASQPSLVVRASLEHLWVDWLVAVSIWSSQSSHSPESDAKSLGIDDQHHVE